MKTKSEDAAFGSAAVNESGDQFGEIGLTKREYFAANCDFNHDEITIRDSETFKLIIGRAVNESNPIDLIKAACEVEAKLRVMKADALINELNK